MARMSSRLTLIPQLSLIIFINCLMSSVQELGAARVPRIAGGTQVKPHEIYYQASLRLYDMHICGGVIISEKHILTAAHCVAGIFTPPFEELNVVTGTVSSKKGVSHSVFNVTWHPKFLNDPNLSFPHDIAVITLEKEIKENDKQRAISLPSSAVNLQGEAVISGWGHQEPMGYTSKTLQKALVKLIDTETCQNFHKHHPITEYQICTEASEKIGICKGDSGGPMVIADVLIGIASWNIPPCVTGMPDVYTNVFKYLDFIKEAMNPMNQLPITSNNVI